MYVLVRLLNMNLSRLRIPYTVKTSIYFIVVFEVDDLQSFEDRCLTTRMFQRARQGLVEVATSGPLPVGSGNLRTAKSWRDDIYATTWSHDEIDIQLHLRDTSTLTLTHISPSLITLITHEHPQTKELLHTPHKLPNMGVSSVGHTNPASKALHC